MSTGFVDNISKNRSEFIKHLKADLANHTKVIEEANERLEELQATASNVRLLGQKPEHISLVPLAKNIYVNATIVHTGEYLIDHTAFPDSYSVLETLDGTIKLLERKIRTQSELVERSKSAMKQTQERIALLEGSESSSGDTENLPKEIVSDRGVAIKTGDFYEILEFED